jgi:hypothetical protein
MWRDSKGVVYVEFLLVFPPLFLLFLFILQSAIIRTSDIGLRHAAASAVRSAIVVLPDDPYAYEGQATNEIQLETSCSEGFVGKLDTLLGKIGVNSLAIPDDGKCLGGPRMSAIRFAAIMRMLPFSPNPQSMLPRRLSGAFDALGTAGWIAGAAAYSYGATAVTFPEAPDSKEMRRGLSWGDNEEVTVRVSYLAHCGIPIARFFMCDSGRSLLAGVDGDFFRRDFKGRNAARKRIKSSKETLANNMSLGVGNRAIFLALMLSGERFMVLSSDATLPLNSAPYDYQQKRD